MGDEQFRLPGSSYEELAKIIAGYGRFDVEVPPSEVGKVIGVHDTIVSRNNAFLVAVGLVSGGKRKAVTPLGKGLARAIEHLMPEEIARHWQNVIAGVPFFQNLVSSVRIRRGMDPSTLQAHVAYSAGVKKSPAVMAGAAAVVEIMRAAGVLREEGGKLVAADDLSSTSESAPPDSGAAQVALPAPVSVAASRPDLPTMAVPVPSGAFVNIQLQIQVQCAPADLDSLGEKLRALIESIKGTSADDED